jgi:hypothetical protein
MNIMPEPEAPEPEPQEAIKLDAVYDCCLLGASMSIHEDERFAYSVSKLIRYERTRLKITTAEAREALADIITTIQREAGPLAPIFINDELIEPVEDENAVKIVQPGDPGFRRPRPNR